MGLHTGEAELRDGDYFGTAVNRAARLMAVGHGGQVLCSSATAEMVGEAVILVDLGEHRLRDLDRPVQVFQVGGGTFAPLRSLDVLPGNLPSLPSSFVGRQAELAAVAKELGTARLVTLTGVGGVGKTRLALQVAAELLPGFADGAWLCELAAAANADELAQVVAIALGVVQRQQMTLEASIVDFLRPRQMLVVLDNCEHLLDAAAGLAEAILAGAPGVRVLATSREGLGIPGEHVWPLRSLSVASDLAEAGQSDAVTLFAERAQAVHPEFVLDEVSTPGVTEVCRRLDGIPLAIELAAARVGAMSPAEIAGHLDERFRLLTGGRRGRVERHQTLLAAVEWSYSLLTGTERAVFDRLGVFPARFDEAAAVAVSSGDGIERWDVIDALASLVAKSMVGAERTGDTTRYQLLETLRHFARERAGVEGDIDGLRRRHAAHYAAFTVQAGATMWSPDELAWRPRVLAELDNLRAATGWAFDAPSLDDVGLGVEMLNGLSLTQSSWGILPWAAAAMPRVDLLDAAQRAVVLAAAAYDAFNMGQLDRAKVLGRRAIRDSETFTPALVLALTVVGLSAVASGDRQEATAVLAESRRHLQTDGPNDWLSLSLRVIVGWLADAIGDRESARSQAQLALAFAREVGSPSLLAGALSAYARIISESSPESALVAAEESIGLVDAGASDGNYSAALQTAAQLRAARGDAAGAARAAHAAALHEARVGSRPMMATFIAVAVVVLASHPEGFQAAATLSGAGSGPVLGMFPQFWRVARRDTYDRALAHVAAGLSDDEYTAAQHRGSAMTYDEIVEFTIGHLAGLAHCP